MYFKYFILSCVILVSIMVILPKKFFQYHEKKINYKYVTNPYREDGFGAQFQGILYSAIYAEANDLEFVYTPFKRMAHDYENETNFIANKETLINFIDHFPTAMSKNDVLQLQRRDYIQFCETYLSRCTDSKTLQIVKQLFRANKPADFFANGKFNIAVHMRRPNSDDSRLAGSDVPDKVFLSIIKFLKQTYANKDYLIHIYSQGERKDFLQYTGDNIVLHINESIEDTFTGFVYANVLVISPSSLSYTAGWLSDGIVYYQPFWHPPLPTWQLFPPEILHGHKSNLRKS